MARREPASPVAHPSLRSYAITVGDIHGDSEEIAARCPWLCSVPYIAPSHDLPAVAALIATKFRGEFCWSSSFEPRFVATLMSLGFLTMAQAVGADLYALLPKMHKYPAPSSPGPC